MTALLNFREALKEIYAKYDTYVTSIWKFLLAFVSFLLINGRMGHLEKLDSIFIVLILSLFCSFMPANTIVFLGSALILGHLYGLSLPALLVGGGILILLLLLYMGTIPQAGYVLVLTMLALALRIPCIIPLVFGLVSGPAAVAAVCFGVVAYYAVGTVNGTVQAAAAGSASAAEESQAIVENVRELLEGILQEDRMVLMLISMTAAFLVVWLIRKMAVKHAWSLAIGMGVLVFLVVDVLGCVVFGNTGEIPVLLIGTAVSALIALCVKFFLFHVDYSRAVSVQFEDGEYYYYVKAVPKIKKGSEVSGGN